ncbi:MAG: FecR domain-containing protein [Burkholderiaceae bacterium]
MNFRLLTAVSGLYLSLVSPAFAAGGDVDLPYRSGVEIEYKVQPTDTASDIRQRLLRRDITWGHIQSINGLRGDARLRAGQVLRIPVTWLKFGPKFAKVSAISGPVTINGQPADKNSKFTENDTIETSANGVIVVLLPDGTQLNIAPSSLVRIERLRQYFDGDTVDARLRLERGQIESNTPEIKVTGPGDSKRDIRIQTPKATAAVRGTQFRVSDDAEVSASSVLSGKVDWHATGSSTQLPKGYGASADASGNVTPAEVLLQAPQVHAPEQVQTQTSGVISFDPIPDAVAYRVRIAANSHFSSDLTERVVTDTSVRLDSQRDGNHFIAVRGISKNGVGGLDGIGKISFLARPLAPDLAGPANQFVDFADRAALSWAQNPQATAYRLQVATDKNFSSLVVDTELTANQFEFVRDLAQVPLRRFWRVATVDGWTMGPFTDSRAFVLNVTGPKPSTTRQGNDVLVQWPALPGARYEVFLESEDWPGDKQQVTTAQPNTRFTGLDAGQYKVSVIASFDDTQLSTAKSEATRFQISRVWTSGFGEPIETRDGPLR